MQHDLKLWQDELAVHTELSETSDAVKVSVIPLHLVELRDVILRQKEIVVGNAVMVVGVSLAHHTLPIKLLIVQSSALEKMLVCPV